MPNLPSISALQVNYKEEELDQNLVKQQQVVPYQELSRRIGEGHFDPPLAAANPR